MKVFETTAAALLNPQVREQYLVAYLPAVDCLAIAAQTIDALGEMVKWLPVGDVGQDGDLIVFDLDGTAHAVVSGYPIVLGEVGDE